MSRYKPEEQVKADKERRELELFRQQKLAEDCHRLLQMPEFKRVMSEVIAMGGLFRTVMTGNSATYYRAGEQDYAKKILAFMASADKEAAMELLKNQPLEKSNV